ncbi:MAG: hypothetical protein IPJ69_05000 [Deltaproteobacteria bacterium]|nr:MAG: hypothetical protein IPJ69_05000 [Deltaproteobacteria bacterium]
MNRPDDFFKKTTELADKKLSNKLFKNPKIFGNKLEISSNKFRETPITQGARDDETLPFMNKKYFYSSCLLSLWCVVAFARGNAIRTTDVVEGRVQKKERPAVEQPSKALHNWSDIFDIKNYSYVDPSAIFSPVFSPRVSCQSALMTGALEDALNGDCNWIGRQLLWQLGNGEIVAYSEWDREKKNKLQDLYNRFRRYQRDLGVSCPQNANTVIQRSNIQSNYISAQQAFDLYSAHIAWFLFTETNPEIIPWSLYQFTQTELAELLSSQNYFNIITSSMYTEEDYPERILPGRDYQFVSHRALMASVSCDPRNGYGFLVGTNTRASDRRNLIARSPSETLVNISYFAHQHFTHGNLSDANNDIRNHYFTLSDRLRNTEGVGIVQYGGCHSATSLIYDLAKSIKIPLKVIFTYQLPTNGDGSLPSEVSSRERSYHEGLVFNWSNVSTVRVLPHTDLTYANFTPFFPGSLSSASAASQEEKKRSLFNNIWLTPESARRRGFQYLPHLPAITVGLVPLLQSMADRPSLGVMGGYWLRGCVDGAEGCLENVFIQERGYNLCSWNDYVRFYCLYHDLSVEFYTRFLRESYIDPAPFSIPGLLNVEQRIERAQMCVMANGGCNNIRDILVPEFSRYKSNDGWHD